MYVTAYPFINEIIKHLKYEKYKNLKFRICIDGFQILNVTRNTTLL